MTNTHHFVSQVARPPVVIFVLFVLGSATFLVSPQTAHAGIVAGSCGGTVVTDFSCSTYDYTYQTCSSAQRAYYNNPDVFIRTCTGDPYYGPRGYCQADAACSNPPAAVTSFSGNPNPVVRGNNVALSWSSTNATSCTSPQFATGGTPSGTISVPVTAVGSMTYELTCTGPGGSSGITTYVASVSEPSFNAVCSANMTSATVGQTVTWNASASNGTTPYAYEWIGQIIDGLTGSSAQAVYTTTGAKTAIIKVTDSSSTSGSSISRHNNSICTGPVIAGNITPSLQEDGGQQSDMQNYAVDLAQGVFYGAQGVEYNQAYRSTYDAVVSNPGGYCVDVKLTQACNPGGNIAWEGCNFQFRTAIHSGNGRRATTASDFGDYAGNPPWDRTRFYGAVTGTNSPAVPRTIQRACTTTVNVTANAPTASLTANPVAIIAGQSSTLTWSSTNATSCTGTNFSTAGATSGTLSVTPAVTTTYSVQCTGPGGDSPVTPATVNVTPVLSGTCAVSPAQISAGGTATWTATPSGGNGVYTYSWSGTNGLTGTTNPLARTYSAPGTNTGSVVITSGSQNVTVACGNSLAVRPAPPTGLAHSCNAAGTQVTLSWNPTPGANNYYVRLSSGGAPVAYTDGHVPTSIVHAVNPGQAYDWWVHSNVGAADYDSNRYSDPTYGAFTCNGPAPQPDLTAGSISPTTATAGTPVSFTVGMSNSGNAGTGSGFTDLFQRANDSSGSGASDMGTWPSPAMPASGNNTASRSYTFASAGTFYVRACADKSSMADSGTIAESNEGNNCGPWTAVTVAAATPPSVSCSVSPSSILTGASATYTAVPANGATAPYSWLDSDGWTDSSAGTNISRSYSTPGTYSMRVRGSNTGYSYCSNNLTVGPSTCTGPASVTITASPDRVKEGDTSTISWTASSVGGASPSCTISGPGVSQVVPAGATPSCQIPNGSATPTITRQSTYTITCTDGATRSVTVNIVPKFVEF